MLCASMHLARCYDRGYFFLYEASKRALVAACGSAALASDPSRAAAATNVLASVVEALAEEGGAAPVPPAGAAEEEALGSSLKDGFKKLDWYAAMPARTKSSTSVACPGVSIHLNMRNGAAEGNFRSCFGVAKNFFQWCSIAARPTSVVIDESRVPRRKGTEAVQKFSHLLSTCLPHCDTFATVCSDGACCLSKLERRRKARSTSSSSPCPHATVNCPTRMADTFSMLSAMVVGTVSALSGSALKI